MTNDPANEMLPTFPPEIRKHNPSLVEKIADRIDLLLYQWRKN